MSIFESSRYQLKAQWYWLLGAIGPVLIFAWMGRNRFVDGDEGFYLIAAKLITQGRVPYSDFFYPQMPILAYVYSWWFELFQPGWISARVLAVVLSFILLLTVAIRARKVIDNALVSLLMIYLLAFNSLAFCWFPVAKTYALTALLLCWSLLAFARIFDTESGRVRNWLICSGLFLGLAVATRLMVAGLIPVFVLALVFWRGPIHQKWRNIVYFALGGVLGCLPLLPFMIRELDVFWFNNLIYHGLRSDGGLVGDFQQKLDVLQHLFGRRPAAVGYSGVQNVILLIVTSLLWQRGMLSPFGKLLGSILIMLSVISLMPSPSFVQYFAVLMPILTLFLIELVRYRNKPISSWRKNSVVGLLVVYFLVSIADIYRYSVSGDRVPGVDDRMAWSIDAVEGIENRLQNYMAYGSGCVASFWPGYVLGLDAELPAGMENHFTWVVESKLTSQQAAHYKIMQKENLDQLMRNGECPWVVFNLWAPDRKMFEEKALDYGYTQVFSQGTVSIYSLPPVFPVAEHSMRDR